MLWAEINSSVSPVPTYIDADVVTMCVAGGHYTAYVKHCQSQAWNLFNDAQVEPRVPEGDNQDDAYILFYKRSGINHNIQFPNYPKIVT